MNKTVFITPIPAFYKVNLYNEIAKSKDISAWFLGNQTIENRSSDFVSTEMNFDYCFINKGSFQSRNKIISCFRVIKKLLIQNNSEVIIGGWDTIEFWMVILLLNRNKVSLVLESSALESKKNGIKGFLKKVFLKKVSKVYASGDNHIKLLQDLNYNGDIIKTKGVGLINYISKSQPLESYKNKFLYIGRLSEVKNLAFLIKVFNKLPEYSLTIIGEGPDKIKLESMSEPNINFVGSVENKELSQYFSQNNFLILPSLSETWGLVVEEAFYNGMPIIVSKNCGSVDLVKDKYNGYIFDPTNTLQFEKIIKKINNSLYQKLKNNIGCSIIEDKDLEQVNTYI
ncbi:glycosyltransferase [Flavobacteriaceae bacterium]|nr:glycosyltransferase [Flavobacteriaceae bacterium]